MNVLTQNEHSSDFPQREVARLGRIAVESMQKTGKYTQFLKTLSEKKNIDFTAKETLDVTETSLFTTAIAAFIEKKLEPKLVAAGAIKEITNFNTRGANGLKVPIRSELITASDLPDSGAVSYDSGTYGSTTITLSYKYAANKITHEIAQFANVDLMAAELGQIGSAVARKYDSDIISAMQTATTTANGNLTKLGTTTEITFDTLVNGLQSAQDNYAEPKVLLVSPETAATIIKLDEFSSGNSVTGALSFQGSNGVVYPYPREILGMRMVVSQQVDDDDIYLIDVDNTGYAVRSGEMEVFDGRISGSLAFEVIGALNYGVSIVQPKAIYRIEENAAP